MVTAPEETVEKTNNVLSSQRSGPGLSLDDVLGGSSANYWGKERLFVLIYHGDGRYEGSYPASGAAQQYQMEPA